MRRSENIAKHRADQIDVMKNRLLRFGEETDDIHEFRIQPFKFGDNHILSRVEVL